MNAFAADLLEAVAKWGVTIGNTLKVVAILIAWNTLTSISMIFELRTFGYFDDFIFTFRALMFLLKLLVTSLAGPFAAYFLWEKKPIGRILAVLIYSISVLYGIASIFDHAGFASTQTIVKQTAWSTLALVILLLPASARACRDENAGT